MCKLEQCVCMRSDLPSLWLSALCSRSLAIRGNRLMAIPPWLSSSSRLYITEAVNGNELQHTNAIALTTFLVSLYTWKCKYNTEVLLRIKLDTLTGNNISWVVSLVPQIICFIKISVIISYRDKPPQKSGHWWF